MRPWHWHVVKMSTGKVMGAWLTKRLARWEARRLGAMYGRDFEAVRIDSPDCDPGHPELGKEPR